MPDCATFGSPLQFAGVLVSNMNFVSISVGALFDSRERQACAAADDSATTGSARTAFHITLKLSQITTAVCQR